MVPVTGKSPAWLSVVIMPSVLVCWMHLSLCAGEGRVLADRCSAQSVKWGMYTLMQKHHSGENVVKNFKVLFETHLADKDREVMAV